MKRLPEILLSAVASLLLSGVLPAQAQVNNAGATSRISNMPAMGLSYPAQGQPPAAAEVAPAAAAALTAPKTTTSVPPAPKVAQTAAPAAQSAPLVPAKPPVSAYDSQGQPYSGQYYKEHLQKMTLVMLRRPELKPGQFVLRMTGEYPMTGCPRISNIPTHTDFNNGTLEITLDDYAVDMRHMSGAPEYACHTAPHSPAAEIVLDRDDLLSKNVHEIQLKMGHSSDIYDVDINDQRLRLTPSPAQKTFPVFHPMRGEGLVTPLTHWFYPAGTVILYAPGAPRTADTAQAMTDMAKSEGLEPLADEMPDFVSPVSNPDMYYFVDKKGTVSKSPEIAAGAVAGVIPVKKTVYGLEKDEEQTKDIQVLARAPGSYE